MDEHDDLDDYSVRYSESDDILKFWPMKDSPPRKTQIEALEWIAKLPAKIKYILCELPVGTGKSAMGINYASWLSKPFGNSFVLTPQKILQRQYVNSFDSRYVASLEGKGNYECKSKNTNCEIGDLISPPCENCPAKQAKERALHSPNMVLNYTLALLLFKYADKRKFPSRKLIIFDECHTLETHLTEFNAVSISENRCKKIGIHYQSHKVMERALEWIDGEYYNAVCKKLKEYVRITDEINLEVEFHPRKLTKDEQAAFKSAKELGEHVDSLDEILLQPIEKLKEEYVLVQDTTKSFKFKMLYGRRTFHSLVKPMSDCFLFMSATILNKEGFCRDLGLPESETAFLSLPSEFPVEHRPILFTPVCKVNYEFFNDENYSNRQDMVVKVKEILDSHSTESGIIHTSSFKFAEWLVGELGGIVTHDILHHNPSSKFVRDDIIAEYLRVATLRPTVLISPSISEGLDLVGDLGRYSIILKCLFPNMTDAFVKRRMELSQEWYQRQAMIGIMQAAGRVTRAKEDWAVNYLLDSSFNYLYHQMYKSIPLWWHEGLIKI